MLKSLLEKIVKKLVEKPDSVEVSEVEANGKNIIQVRVSAPDIGRVIGSEGRTFRALRTLVNVLESSSEGRDLVVDLVE